MNDGASKQSLTRNYSFGKSRRLLTGKQYQSVFGKVCIKQHSKYFTFLCATNHSGSSRLGLAIAKKSIPLAARRNLLKRITRETFRTTFTTENHTGPDLDIVVLAKPAANQLDRAQITQELNHQWRLLIQRNQSPNKTTAGKC